MNNRPPFRFRFAMHARYLQLAAEYRAQGQQKLALTCVKNAHRALDAEVRGYFAEDDDRGDEGDLELMTDDSDYEFGTETR